jgi:cellulose synthase/poly-beta-1,6-N-acetylglucosamine synthase-like glycosyltransferase
MIALFWACVAIIAYVYFGYPLLLASGVLGRRRPVLKRRVCPTISVIIPALNEEWVIEEKLQNVLALDYPRDRVEVLVGSDGSDDRTEDIVRLYAPQGVRLIAHSQQQGKSATQNELVAHSSGEILLFTDADCLLSRDAVSRVVENFADPRVGLVTAEPVYLNTGETDVGRNEGLYWRYETWLRQEESDRGLLAMASGWLFAARRSLWKPLGPDVGDDFALPLQVALQGCRNVIEQRAHLVTELTQKQIRSMLGMKMRIVSKDLRGLLANKSVLNPLKTGPLAIALFSHKLLRWLIPYFLVGVLVTNLFLISRPLYRVTMLLQLAFYLSALFAAFLRKRWEWSPFSVSLSFCVVNLAALIGTLHCAAGRRVGRWKPVRQAGPGRVHSTASCPPNP